MLGKAFDAAARRISSSEPKNPFRSFRRQHAGFRKGIRDTNNGAGCWPNCERGLKFGLHCFIALNLNRPFACALSGARREAGIADRDPQQRNKQAPPKRCPPSRSARRVHSWKEPILVCHIRCTVAWPQTFSACSVKWQIGKHVDNIVSA